MVSNSRCLPKGNESICSQADWCQNVASSFMIAQMFIIRHPHTVEYYSTVKREGQGLQPHGWTSGAYVGSSQVS